MHKRIWRVAEATVEAALADLSARESKQLCALLQRVKETLVSGADGPAKARRHGRRPRIRPRAGRAATTGGSRRDAAPATTGAGRRARAGRCRRAGLLAAGRPPRQHRERLRQGRHHPDRQRSSRPHHRGARSGTIRSSRPATCCVRLDPAPYQLALAKAEAEVDSARAAVEQLKASLREIRAETREAENKLTFLQAQAQRAARSVGTRRDIGREARASQQRGAGRRWIASRCCTSASPASRRRSAASRTGRPTRLPPSARSWRCAIAPRSISPIPRSRRRGPASSSTSSSSSASRSRRRRRCSRWSPIAGPGWRPISRRPTSPTSPSGRRRRSCSTCIPTSPGMPRSKASARRPAPSSRSCRRRMPRGNWVKVVQRLPVRLRLIERPGEPPLRAGMTAYVSIDTGRTRSLAGIFGNGAAVAARPQAAGCDQDGVIFSRDRAILARTMAQAVPVDELGVGARSNDFPCNTPSGPKPSPGTELWL